MTFRKFRSQRLFDGFRMRDDNPVLIVDKEGKIEGILPSSEAGDDIEDVKGIITPGFINCHCHLELSHMKGIIPEGTGLAEFVTRIIKDRHIPEEEILAAIDNAEDQMFANGIVAVGDICNNASTIRQKLKGRIWYHNFIEATGYHPTLAEQRFQRSLAFFQAYAQLYSIPIESNSITPHAPYSVVDELWERIIYFPGNHLFTIHNQESAGENEWFKEKKGELSTLYEKLKMDVEFFRPSGKSSLQTYLGRFLPNQSIILVHNVYTSEEDILFSQKSKSILHWCFCPNANRYIGGKLPDLGLFLKHNCSIVLGTDSIASNWSLNIVEEIKTLRQVFPDIPLDTMLQWATLNGARALQVDSLMGSFEKNKTPGVVLLSEDLSSVARLA